MINFRDGTIAYSILLHIASAGEFPWSSLNLLGDKRIYQRRIADLKAEGYVTVNGSGEQKTIRMTKKALKVIQEKAPAYYSNYMSVTDNHHFRGGTYKAGNTGARQTQRRHRMAEIICFVEALDFKYLPLDKPQLKIVQDDNKPIKKQDKLFYSSRELKNTDTQQRYKTEFTRIMGVLYSPGGVYCVYHTNKGLMKWNSQGEGKAQVLVDDITRASHEEENTKTNKAIMFVKDMNVANEILSSKGGVSDALGFEPLSFDNTYANIYIVPLDINGILQAKIITTENWYNTIRTAMFEEQYISYTHSTIDCDAIVDNKDYKLMFFDGDIGRLKRFKQAISANNAEHFTVFCFDWQLDFLKKYMPEGVEITPIPHGVVLKFLKPKQ